MKKAFTLVEIILAVLIFGIIMIYMYDILAVTKKSTKAYEKIYEKDQKAQQIKKLFYNDIFNQIDPYSDTSLKTKDDYTTYHLRTSNSIHGLINPFVAYSVLGKTLYRFESVREFELPLDDESLDHVFFDKIATNLDNFLIYSYKNDKLITYSINKQKTIFEISLPYSKKVIIVKQ